MKRGRKYQIQIWCSLPKACHSFFPVIFALRLKVLPPVHTFIQESEWCSDRSATGVSLLYLLQADSGLIFPSARWILAQLPSISICAEVKSLQDLGLNTGCQATAPSDPPKPHPALAYMDSLMLDVDEAGGGGGGRIRPGQIAEAGALISSPIGD